MLTSYPEGLVAVVSDSYDIYNACKTLWGKELVELIKNRKGCLVVRPDSGDPPVIVCEVLELLAEAFGTEKTETGHKLLPPYIRVIQGDGVSYESLGTILAAMEAKGWAAGNLAFGSGGALLQKLNRDTQKCAFKCCEAIVNGEARYVYKDPVTDKGKASKKGQLKLVKDGASYKTLTEGQGDAKDDLLVTVFENGVLMKDWSKLEVSANAAVINKKGIVAGSVLPG
eukprot:Transcript_28221.p4 GENE.Transcript_28221~~Transcript_28221.p4  ORF type:complete len:227 (-),score=137.28 Transcript_28221:386-1066(-)